VAHEEQLRDLVRSHDRLTSLLRLLRDVALPEWAVTAGVIRNVVWDSLHGYDESTPVKDVDVAFYDVRDKSRERDAAIEGTLTRALPNIPWEVTNQAGVHLWYERKFGHPIPPITSLHDGISRYPETATSVGIRLEANDAITVIAPCGLSDLFGMVLRRNPTQVTRDYFRQRLRDKRITERWPKVTVIDD
jgi:hypothetical protein